MSDFFFFKASKTCFRFGFFPIELGLKLNSLKLDAELDFGLFFRFSSRDIVKSCSGKNQLSSKEIWNNLDQPVTT